MLTLNERKTGRSATGAQFSQRETKYFPHSRAELDLSISQPLQVIEVFLQGHTMVDTS